MRLQLNQYNKRIRRIILSSLAVLYFFSNANSQIKITGVVIDSLKSRLVGATVEAKPVDSDSVLKTQTDSAGIFVFSNLRNANYNINISCIGYKSKSITVGLAKDTSFISVMDRDPRILEEVTIQTSKPVLQRKVDRFVYNLSGSSFAYGLNAFEVLRLTPMVQANEQKGVLKLLGAGSGAAVFINRKRLNLGGNDLVSFLKGLPSENIERIELLTIPPPFYDTDGPVIDIIVKKLSTDGLIGSATAYYSRTTQNQGGGSLSLTYNKSRFNQLTSINVGGGNNFREINTETAFLNSGASSHTNLPWITKSNSFNILENINYELTPLLTLGTQLIYSKSHNHGLGTGETTLSQEAASQTDLFNHDKSVGSSIFNGNIFLRYYSEKKEKYAELNINGLGSSNKQDYEYNATNNSYFKSNVPQKTNGYSIKLDYSSKLKKDFKLELGGKFSNSISTTSYQFFIKDASGYVVPSQLENFKYNEYVSSGYGTLAKEFSSKFSAKIGLNLQNSVIHNRAIDASNLTTKNVYTFLIPIGYINYARDQNHSISLTSKLNTERPAFFSLNPSKIQTAVTTFNTGNPYLSPAHGGSLELIYGLYQKYFFGANYNYNKDQFGQVNSVVPPDTLLIKWENWGKSKSYNIWFYTSQSWFKCWDLNLFVSGQYQKTSIYSQIKALNNFQSYLSLNNTLRNIVKNVIFFANINFNSPSQDGVWKTDGGYRIDLGSKISFKKAGIELSVMCNDITKFNDHNQFVTNITNDQKTVILNNYDRRGIFVSLTKSFGNLKTRKINAHDTGNQEERNRL